MPAFMYICGMVSFSRSFRVTLGIFGFLGVLTVLASSVVVSLKDIFGDVDDAEMVVVGGEAEVVV